VIVEIAGSSGSGKSTLLKEVLASVASARAGGRREDFLMPWLSGVIRRNPTLLNLALDLRSVSERSLSGDIASSSPSPWR